MRNFFTALTLLASLFIWGCQNYVNLPDQQQITMSFTTFNAGLSAETVPYSTERKDFLKTAIAALDSDVVCLQEIWDEADAKEIIKAAKVTYPNSYYSVTEGDGSTTPTVAPCTQEELTPLAICYMSKCGTSGTDPLTIGLCIAQNCTTELTGIPTECRNCLINAVSGGTADMNGILAACTSAPKPAEWNHAGNNGLLILSKHQMKNQAITVLDSFYNIRAALYAKINKGLFGDVELICTDLTEAVGDMTYAGKHTSWEGETLAQSQQVLAIKADKKATMRVIMGDLNSSPAISRKLKALNPDVYNTFYDADYFDPYVSQNEVTCTWCAENPLVSTDAGDNVPDHVFFSVYEDFYFTSERVFDSTYTYTDKSEKETLIRLSNHYGIKAVISKTPFTNN